MADKNPLFAEFDAEKQSELDLSAAPALLQANSPNHGAGGQNVLFNDGSVRFSESRYLGPALDDIFTIKNTSRYYGNELPQDDDIFIAP